MEVFEGVMGREAVTKTVVDKWVIVELSPMASIKAATVTATVV
jgi:hypothetical protein